MLKVFTLSIFAGCLQLSAHSVAQTVSLSLHNARLSVALDQIQAQTAYRFIYVKEHMELASPVTIHLRNENLRTALDLLFRNQPLDYNIEEPYIVIHPREKTINAPPPVAEAVRGRVLTQNNEPVPGVSVLLKGTPRGVSTDVHGEFDLPDVPNGSVLVISAIGYEKRELTVGGNRILIIHLDTTTSALDELVVKGYYNTTRRLNTGSVSSIGSAAIQQQPVSNVLGAMEGLLPGVYIQQTNGLPGGGFNIQVRGQNSIINGNLPLYIVDGIPFNGTTLSSPNTAAAIFTAAGANPLNMINPGDIERVEVLKDADATAIYGSRGANGVVLITTKRGKAGKTSLTADLRQGWGSVARRIDLLNTQQYLAMRHEAFANDKVNPTTANAPDLLRWDTTRYTDWQKTLFGKSAKTTNAQVSLSGGNLNTQFLLSGGYYRESTVFPGSFADERGNFHHNIHHQSSNGKLDATFSLNYGVERNNLPGSDISAMAYSLAPDAPALYDSSGKLNWATSTWTNPLAYLNRIFKAASNNLVGNINVNYALFKGVKANLNIGYTDISRTEKLLTPSTYYDPNFGYTPLDATAVFSTASVKNWIVEPQLNWRRSTSFGNFEALVGSTISQQSSEALLQTGTGFSSDQLIGNLKAANTVTVGSYTASLYKYAAAFARLNYSIRQTYLLNITARRDGSSRFGPGKQFANFGAIGAAWIFSNEKIFHPGNFFSFGKLKASYGTSGNDQIGDYKFMDTYTTASTYAGVAGLTPARLFNPSFAWETNRKLNVGLDLGFLRNRVLLSAEFYLHRSSNELVGLTLPPTTGFSSIQANLPAVVENRGLELAIDATILKDEKITWTSNFNISIPKNKLLSFPGLASSTYATSYVIGQPLRIAQVYAFTGLNPDNGLYGFKDVNADGLINVLDKKAVVFLGQHYYGAWQNTIGYKKLRATILIQFTQQNALNYFANPIFSRPGIAKNEPVEVLNHWVSKGHQSAFPFFTTGTNAIAVTAWSNYIQSNGAVSNASFIRLRNVEISYPFQLGGKSDLNIRAFVQGQNLIMWTRYQGIDPEAQGSNMPPLRMIVIGAQLNL